MRKFLRKLKDGMIDGSKIQDSSLSEKTSELIALNKELSDRVNELKAELAMGTETIDQMKAEVLRQSALRQQAENKAYKLESRKNSETSINSDAINDKLVMQGVLFRAREVARDMVPLLEEANEASYCLPAPKEKEEKDAIAILQSSLGKACRYANMLPNDGGGENLLITQGMMEERAKVTGEPVYESSQVEAIKERLERDYRKVEVVPNPNDFGFLIQLQAGDYFYKGPHESSLSPEMISIDIGLEIEKAQTEHAKDCVPEGSGMKSYDEDGFKKRCMNDDCWPFPDQVPGGKPRYYSKPIFELINDELGQHGETRP